jgi:1-aminocyclopropane-1-carboxylate deaminase
MNQEYVAYAAESYCLHHQFHGGGYAKTNEELHTFQHKFASQTGIILDPVYEAKMMFGLISLIEQNYFAPGTRICALHNGGLLGVLSR